MGQIASKTQMARLLECAAACRNPRVLDGLISSGGEEHNKSISLPDLSRMGEIIDARAELPISSPAAGVPTPPVREVKVADAASVFDAGASALMPAAPVTDLPIGQLTPESGLVAELAERPRPTPEKPPEAGAASRIR
ncbi:hypothetical protein [Bradyrhizobium sp. 195]|uniref:hypothetical protein n=1 Tax=Bradyrhizobium sp. 195 TaxID=2782662 RepID=UPI00200098C7|nr:hypothetical protein [Bradyrhizobium sp. 195]UPK31093.1 hypothetical protein IVB26_38655 [Bradyrhizobium sp. 195]